MYWALTTDLVDKRGLEFEQVLGDIQTLNQRARAGRLEVTAISLAAYPFVQEDYALVPHGASIGSGHGPPRPASTPTRPSHGAIGDRVPFAFSFSRRPRVWIAGSEPPSDVSHPTVVPTARRVFRCELCGAVQPPHTKVVRLTVKGRTRRYPLRVMANTFRRLDARGKPRTVHSNDPGGVGREAVVEVARHPPLESQLQGLTGMLVEVVDRDEALIASADAEMSATITSNRNLVLIARQFVWMELFTQRISARLGADLLSRLDPQDRKIFDPASGASE